MLWYCDRATIKSLSVPFNCHFLFRILCRDAITAPPKKKRKTTESTTDIHVSKPRTPRSTRYVYQRNPATVSISNYTTPSTDSNIPILAENNTGTTPNMNIGYARLAEEIIRLQILESWEEYSRLALETFVQIHLQQLHHPFWLQILNFHPDSCDLTIIIL
jgi:hypothetical protein